MDPVFGASVTKSAAFLVFEQGLIKGGTLRAQLRALIACPLMPGHGQTRDALPSYTTPIAPESFVVQESCRVGLKADPSHPLVQKCHSNSFGPICRVSQKALCCRFEWF